VRCLNPCLFQKRVLLVIWINELGWRVIVRIAFSSSVDKFAIHRGYNREVFITLVDAHHILHGVSMWSCKRPEPMPVGHLFNLKERIHDRGQFKVLIELARWLGEAVVIMVSTVRYIECVKEFIKRKVNPLGPISKIGEPIIGLLFGPNNLVTSNLSNIGLIVPSFKSFLVSCIIGKKTRSPFSHILVIKLLGSNCIEVTKWNLVIIGLI